MVGEDVRATASAGAWTLEDRSGAMSSAAFMTTASGRPTPPYMGCMLHSCSRDRRRHHRTGGSTFGRSNPLMRVTSLRRDRGRFGKSARRRTGNDLAAAGEDRSMAGTVPHEASEGREIVHGMERRLARETACEARREWKLGRVEEVDRNAQFSGELAVRAQGVAIFVRAGLGVSPGDDAPEVAPGTELLAESLDEVDGGTLGDNGPLQRVAPETAARAVEAPRPGARSRGRWCGGWCRGDRTGHRRRPARDVAASPRAQRPSIR